MTKIEKVIYFLDFSESIGGSSKVLLTQAHIMKLRGYQVKMILPIQSAEISTKECLEICNKYSLEVFYANYTVSTCMEGIDILRALKDYREIVCLLDIEKPDLIHSAQLNIAVELAARDLEIPHLMNIYPVDLDAFSLNWIKIYPQYHSADSIMLSERWSDGLEIPSRCIRVAYEEKERNRVCASVEEHPTVTILSIGVFSEHKNQLEMIKFVLLCKQTIKKINFIFLGDYNNSYGEKCRRFVEDHNLWDCVRFEGFVLAVEDYLKKADVFILASTVESYPGVIVESMANKVPIITTPVAGVPELLEDGKNALFTKGHEAKYIYEAFLRYLDFQEKGKIEKIVENAYNTYLENHTYTAVGNQLEDYYYWIVNDYYSKKSYCLTADEIREKFEGIITKNVDGTMLEMQSLIWFLYHVFVKMEQKDNQRIAIWGAGFWGKQILGWIHSWGKEHAITGFIDINKEGTYMGYPIFRDKEEALVKCGVIFVAIENQMAILEIMDYLEAHGRVRNQDYFLIRNSPLIRI